MDWTSVDTAAAPAQPGATAAEVAAAGWSWAAAAAAAAAAVAHGYTGCRAGALFRITSNGR